MSHLTDNRWHGYETEPRTVVITVESDLSSTQIDVAALHLTGQASVALTPQSNPGGYKLTAEVTLPAAGFYAWTAVVQDEEGNTPIVVAKGDLRVEPLTVVAAP